MNKILLLLSLAIFPFVGYGQLGNTTCANAIQICFENPIAYPATINGGQAETGPAYGCLSSRPNPAWFYFQVGTPGPHQLFITNSMNRDLDFIIYGPFTTGDDWCDSLTVPNTADCSYAGGPTETANFTSVNAGDIYVLLITNFSNQNTNVNIIQNAGTGSFTCNFTAPCITSLVTATPGICDTTTNQYALSGQIWGFNFPDDGQLNITLGTNTQTLQGPFNSPVSFTFSGLPSNGQVQQITAGFSGASSCSGTGSFTAPSGCIPCVANASGNSPVCEGDTIFLGVEFNQPATFQWSGPDFFTSQLQNPILTANPDVAAGVYTVLITGQNCVSERSVAIDITEAPIPQAIAVETEICEGDILFLGAVDVQGGSYSWTGPNGFQAFTRNTQVNNTVPASSGDYLLNLSVNGCSNGADTVSASVFPSPSVSIDLPDFVNPQNGSSLFYVSGAQGLNYQWNFIGNTTLITASEFNATGDSVLISWDGGEGIMGAQVIATDSNGCVSEPVQDLCEVVIPLGVKIPSTNEVLIYPNPATDVLHLDLASNYHVSVFDIKGSLVYAAHLGKGTHTLPCALWSKGIYHMHVTNGSQSWLKHNFVVSGN
jgi:hypothetical protein